MLRPEQIRCGALAGAGAAPIGRVTATPFYGHDATVSLVLEGAPGQADGREILARAAGGALPAVGDRVAIAVDRSALIYP
jgi:hypothetical protein